MVTFFYRGESPIEDNQDLFDADITKVKFDVDGYGIELGEPLDAIKAMNIGYFHGMWSHRRDDHMGKGFIQVDLDPEEDAPARRGLDNARQVVREREEKI